MRSSVPHTRRQRRARSYPTTLLRPSELPLRQGRAIAWIAEALEPLRGELSDAQLKRLALAIRSAIGIEARVWLIDVAGLCRPRTQCALCAGVRDGYTPWVLVDDLIVSPE